MKLAEATLYPIKHQMAEIEAIISDYLDEREAKKKSLLQKIKDYILNYGRKQLSLMPQELQDRYKEITRVMDINERLRDFDISFNPYLDDTALGGITPKNFICIKANLLHDAKKVGGKWDLRKIMDTIGHELIHRHQHERGGTKSKYSQKGSDEKYFNDPAEVMTWAYTTIRRVIAGNENVTLPAAIEFIKTSKSLAKFLSKYTPQNRKKFVRHIIDYARHELDKEKIS